MGYPGLKKVAFGCMILMTANALRALVRRYEGTGLSSRRSS